jgi:hypothetical protein
MAFLRGLLLIVGVLALAIGLLWVGQGMGYIHWPASSFMINEMKWAYRGAALAVGGLIVIIVSRRI